MLLTNAELAEIYEYLQEYINTDEVQSMKQYCQHGSVNTYEHAMHVVKLSYYLNKKFSLGADLKSLIIGSFLHDFYLYDWHEKDISHRWHGWSHPKQALLNANRLFQLNQKEQDIILQHMWPLTLRSIPSCRESLIVCFSDKISSTMETLFQRS